MSKEKKIKSIEINSFSKYKTLHQFENYGEIESVDDYIFYAKWAKENKKDIFILGNGSNTLFIKKRIKSLVLKNSLPREIKCISEKDSMYEVSSNVMMHEILNFCYKNSLDTFYFLSSVPATIGGALAMNAGEGMHLNKTIYDFVESVTYIDSDGSLNTVKPIDINIKYRKTMFTGIQDKFIVSAIFRFPLKDLNGINPIKDRIEWSKKYQDNVVPNCGSVFSMYNGRILGFVKGFKVGKAQYSKKTINWINNNSSSPLSIMTLLFITKLLHIIFRKRYKIEIILVK